MGTLNIRCRIIIGIQKGTIILRTIQIPANPRYPSGVLSTISSSSLRNLKATSTDPKRFPKWRPCSGRDQSSQLVSGTVNRTWTKMPTSNILLLDAGWSCFCRRRQTIQIGQVSAMVQQPYKHPRSLNGFRVWGVRLRAKG